MSDWAIKETPRPTTFIQWKGTSLCADFYCICGNDFYIDTEFAYAVQCPHCNRRYELSTRIELRGIPENEIWDGCEIKLGIGDIDND